MISKAELTIGRESRPAAVQSVASDVLLVTVECAARVLGISRTSVYSLMETGQLRYRKFGRARRIPRAELERLAASDWLGGWNVAQNPDCCAPSQVQSQQGPPTACSNNVATGKAGR